LSNTVTRKSKAPQKLSKAKEALSYVVLLLVLLGLVARPLGKGALFYQNYWGGAVFVPFVLLVGVILVLAVALMRNRK
jgi:hypothetical protein